MKHIVLVGLLVALFQTSAIWASGSCSVIFQPGRILSPGSKWLIYLHTEVEPISRAYSCHALLEEILRLKDQGICTLSHSVRCGFSLPRSGYINIFPGSTYEITGTGYQGPSGHRRPQPRER